MATNNYTANIYPRGATVLNMMRHVLGDVGWWKTIHHYLETHQFNNVEANDLKIAAEEATGQNLGWFFDEWLYKDGHPIYDVNYDYEVAQRMLKVTIEQVQPRDSMTGTFKMPIDIEMIMPDGSHRIETVRDEDSVQSFELACPQQPLNVIFDKGNSILKQVRIHKSTAEWLYQLTHSTLAIERSQAAEEFGEHPEYTTDDNVRNALALASAKDAFWAVRRDALTSLSELTDSLRGYESLVKNSAEHDPNPDVRMNAVGLAARMADKGTALAIANSALEDSSYQINGHGLRLLFLLDKEAGYQASIKALSQPSPRDNVRHNAIDVLAASHREAALDQLIHMIGERNIPKYTRWAIIDGIGELMTVDSAKVNTVLWNLTHNGDRDIRVTALNNLANHGDQRTLDAINTARSEHPDLKAFFDELNTRMKTRFARQGTTPAAH